MKTILTIALILISSVAFAGDIIFAPVISKPAPGEMDTYIIATDKGSKAVHVISLDAYGDDTYLVIDNGKSTVVMKPNFD